MGAAAVFTTALIAAPAVVPVLESTRHDQELADTAHDVPAPASVANAPAVAPAQPLTVARVEAVPVATHRTVVPARRRLRTTSLPPAIRLGLPSPAIATGPAPTILAANVVIDRPSRPLARKLAGFVTGDGTYAVQPFPRISSDRH
jgi:hypothetical protein